MKKKVAKQILTLCLVGTLTTCAPSGIFASDQSGNATQGNDAEKTIFDFRGIDWWAPKTDVDTQLVSEGAEIQDAAFKDNILRMSGIDYAGTTSGKDRVDGGGIVARYSGLKVAGYTPSDTQACYIYNLNDDGTINKNEDSAQFYFGWYTFENRDFADVGGVYNDLSQKLQSLYGDGVTNEDDDYFSTVTWTDSDNNQIRLLLGGKNKDYGYVTLGYIAAGADEKLDEMQVAVDEENVQKEAAEREKNKADVSGL